MVQYDPYSPEAFDDPLPFYAQLRDEAPWYMRGCVELPAAPS